MNTSRFNNNFSLDNSSIINYNFYNEKPNIVKKEEFDESKYIKNLIRGYELIRCFLLDEACIIFKNMLMDCQNVDYSEKTSECLLNLGIIHFFQGKLSKSYYYLLESYKFFTNCLNITLSLDLQKARLLSSLIMVSTSLNITDTALEYNEALIELLMNCTKIYDSSYKEAVFIQTVKSFFFFPDIFSSKFNLDKTFEKIEDLKSGNLYLKYKSFASILMGFMKYIQNDKNIEYFIRCLQEAITNLKIINDNHTLSLSLLCLSLMKIKNEDIKTSKKLALDCFKLLKLNKNFENIYSKLINEQYQKFEAYKIIYNTLNKFYNNHIARNNSSIYNQSVLMIDQVNQSKRSSIKTLLIKVKKEIIKTPQIESIIDIDVNLILQNIEFALKIIDNNDVNIQLILNNLQVDNMLKYYFENIGNNLMFILNREIIKKYFKRFIVLSLGYDNIKQYREYTKKLILDPKLKRFNEKSLEFLENGTEVSKINFSSFGKKEYDKILCGFIVGKSIKFKKNCNICISIDEVKEITLGIKSQNLKAKFHKFKKDLFKKSWRYVSIITKSRSYDFCHEKEENILKLFYAFISVKEIRNCDYKILTKSDFSLHRLKLKLIQVVIEYFDKNFSEKHKYFDNLLRHDLFKDYAYYINISWTLLKLLLFCKKYNLTIKE